METAGRLVDDDELRDALKENGIGRPSTRAAIIQTLFKRHYIRLERKNLIATPTGVELISLIHEELLKSAELTGIWERRLRLIEKKTYDAKTFLEELKQMVAEIVHTVLADNTNRRVAETQEDKPVPKGKKGNVKEKSAKAPKTARKIASKREQNQARLTMPGALRKGAHHQRQDRFRLFGMEKRMYFPRTVGNLFVSRVLACHTASYTSFS